MGYVTQSFSILFSPVPLLHEVIPLGTDFTNFPCFSERNPLRQIAQELTWDAAA